MFHLSLSAFIEFTPSLKANVMYSFGAKFNLRESATFH